MDQISDKNLTLFLIETVHQTTKKFLLSASELSAHSLIDPKNPSDSGSLSSVPKQTSLTGSLLEHALSTETGIRE